MMQSNNVFDIEAIEAQIEINKQRMDEFAIEFAEWLNFNFKLDFTDKAFEELLEIYKKEKGL